MGYVPANRHLYRVHPCTALPQETIHRYVRAFASWRGINSDDNHPDISYNTRVESVTERYTRASDGSLIRRGWTLTLKKLVKTGDHTSKAIWWTEVSALFGQVEPVLHVSLVG